MVVGRGVVVTADTRASGDHIYGEERKVYPVYLTKEGEEIDLAVVAGSGSSSLVKRSCELIKDRFLDFARQYGRDPNENEVRYLIEDIEGALMMRYYRLRELGVSEYANVLLATVTRDGKPMLYLFEPSGLANPMHEVPGYVVLGHGELTGARLLLTLLGYSPERSYHWDYSVLTAFIIDVVSMVDPTVSPLTDPMSSVYIRYDEEKGKVVMGPLTSDAFKNTKDSVQRRIEAVRLLWEAMEVAGEETILKSLQSLKEKALKKEASS
ncbi:MAG: hypothetical protein DRJ67_04355 [Thermoprotei archaeon]|nr:MAG: hypothetical protein DRJ67_04355 [Thermoprotei archaeon]